MIVYKVDVKSMLEQKGINSTTVRKTGFFAQGTMTKFKAGDTNITADVLDRLCEILDLQPGDIMQYIPETTEKCDLGIDNHKEM